MIPTWLVYISPSLNLMMSTQLTYSLLTLSSPDMAGLHCGCSVVWPWSCQGRLEPLSPKWHPTLAHPESDIGQRESLAKEQRWAQRKIYGVLLNSNSNDDKNFKWRDEKSGEAYQVRGIMPGTWHPTVYLIPFPHMFVRFCFIFTFFRPENWGLEKLSDSPREGVNQDSSLLSPAPEHCSTSYGSLLPLSLSFRAEGFVPHYWWDKNFRMDNTVGHMEPQTGLTWVLKAAV